MISERVASIINYDNVLKTSVGKDSHILNIESFFSLHTIFSEQSVLNVFVFRIQIVQNNISVATVRGCENNDFIVLGELLQTLNSIRSNIDTSFNDFTMREFDGQNYITRHAGILIAMNQSFIKIEDNSLFIYKSKESGRFSIRGIEGRGSLSAKKKC